MQLCAMARQMLVDVEVFISFSTRKNMTDHEGKKKKNNLSRESN